MRNLKNKILTAVSDFFIRRKWFEHRNKFQAGDLVKPNWKALATFGDGFSNSIYEVRAVLKFKDSDNLEFTPNEQDEFGGDAYWFRHLYFWERPTDIF